MVTNSLQTDTSWLRKNSTVLVTVCTTNVRMEKMVSLMKESALMVVSPTKDTVEPSDRRSVMTTNLARITAMRIPFARVEITKDDTPQMIPTMTFMISLTACVGAMLSLYKLTQRQYYD